MYLYLNNQLEILSGSRWGINIYIWTCMPLFLKVTVLHIWKVKLLSYKGGLAVLSRCPPWLLRVDCVVSVPEESLCLRQSQLSVLVHSEEAGQRGPVLGGNCESLASSLPPSSQEWTRVFTSLGFLRRISNCYNLKIIFALWM